MLVLRSLGVTFGGIKALSGLDVTVGAREILGLIGPNGAGKTTAFNLITGIYSPTSGSVELDGRRISGSKPHQVTRAGVARTFQNIRLFKQLTVLENVLVARHPRATYGIPSAVLRRLAFETGERQMKADSLEVLEIMGLRSRAGEISANLPYGDQRRLEIARALASGPRVVLLDEPAAGMNDQESATLLQLIRFIRDRFEIAVVLIEHDMKVVMNLCERVIVLDHGVPIAEGTAEQIQGDPAVIEAYLGRREDAAPLRDRSKSPRPPGAASGAAPRAAGGPASGARP